MALSNIEAGGNQPAPHYDLGRRAVRRLIVQDRPPSLMRQDYVEERGTTLFTDSKAICLIPPGPRTKTERLIPLSTTRAKDVMKRIQSVRLELAAEAERQRQEKIA